MSAMFIFEGAQMSGAPVLKSFSTTQLHQLLILLPPIYTFSLF